MLFMAARKNRRKWFWRRQMALWDAALTLAAWRWRTQRFLLCVTGLGVTVAVVLIASLPLFSSVMTTAGLRGVLRAQANSSQILANAVLSGISSDLFTNGRAQVNNLVQRDAGRYLTGKPQATLITGKWSDVEFYGVPMQLAQTHLKILQGHLPAVNAVASATDIDIALTQTAANFLRLKIGASKTFVTSLLSEPFDYTGAYTVQVEVHLVGIFQVQSNDPYWNGYTLEQPPAIFGSSSPPVLALTDQDTLLQMLDAINQRQKGNGIYFFDESTNALLLSYNLKTAAITSSQLGDLIASLGTLQQDVAQNFQSDIFSDSAENIGTASLSGPSIHDPLTGTASTLEKYQSQMQIIQAPGLILTAQILCLILFFISVVVGALVEREQLAIAVMRSRGANQRQVAGSLILQGLALCVLAGLVGPLLALGVVSALAPLFLTSVTRDALNALMLDPGVTLHALGFFTLAAVGAAFLTLLLTIFLAVRANILTQRREEARATQIPLWQRLRLDLAVAALAIAGYVVTYYLESTQQFLSAPGQTLVSAPLELLAPALLLLAGILFFIRLFPLFLRLLARSAQRRRGLTPMLALAQMERAPRQAMRMALLLGLAAAFTLFSLVFSASQSQRAQDLANYQAVSDFSGQSDNLPATSLRSTASPISTANDVQVNARAALAQTTTRYRQIQGVTAVSVGSVSNIYLNLNEGTVQAISWPTRLIAVDPATFAQTAIWDAHDSSQSLVDLMKLLAEQRAQTLQHGIVPALVAANTWQRLGLSQGQTFHLSTESGDLSPTTYLALAEVNHIPPVDDNSEDAILVDYQSLIAGQIEGQGMTQVTAIAQLNSVWLSSGDNPAAISHVRATLNTGTLALSNLMDRRTLGGDNASNPLANGLLSILSIGVAAALLLAFLANLLLPLLSVRMRQTSFAVLRALGTAPGQVTGMLTWELAIVLATSLVLGLLFGTVLAFTSVPPLVFTGALPSSLLNISSSTIYTLQQIIPVTIVIPLSLLVALGTLLMLCLLALGLMTRLAQRPVMAQSLRLSSD
jgi:ABC-type antimicrobial peptide transport system permease subunit